MSLRLSHLTTLTMSVTWVARSILLPIRCERSPSPVMVGANTLCPFFSRRSDTRRQHQPPCHAPCTRTKVFALVCACAFVLSTMPMSPAPAAMAPNTVRRVCPSIIVPPSRYLQQDIHQPLRRVDHHVVTGIGRLEGAP